MKYQYYVIWIKQYKTCYLMKLFYREKSKTTIFIQQHAPNIFTKDSRTDKNVKKNTTMSLAKLTTHTHTHKFLRFYPEFQQTPLRLQETYPAV